MSTYSLSYYLPSLAQLVFMYGPRKQHPQFINQNPVILSLPLSPSHLLVLKCCWDSVSLKFVDLQCHFKLSYQNFQNNLTRFRCLSKSFPFILLFTHYTLAILTSKTQLYQVILNLVLNFLARHKIVFWFWPLCTFPS